MLLRPYEVLLGLDDAGGRLFVWSERGGLRVHASADRRELDRMPLAAMRPTSYGWQYGSLIGNRRDGSDRASRPIMRLPAGEILSSLEIPSRQGGISRHTGGQVGCLRPSRERWRGSEAW